MQTVQPSDLAAWLARLADLHIGVVGDVAVDAYWTLDPGAATVSLETGLPTQPVRTQRYFGGGAANVAVNLRALGCGRVSIFGVLGADPWGACLQQLLDERNITRDGLVCQARDWQTVAFIKPHVDGVEQSRWDMGDFNQLHTGTAEQLVAAVAAALPTLDALVINGQARMTVHQAGVVSAIDALLARHRDTITIVDQRDPEPTYAHGILKINVHEALRRVGLPAVADPGVAGARVVEVADHLYRERGQPLFVTLGDAGMVCCDDTGVTMWPAINCADQPLDPVGAGDAALAGITAVLAAGGTLHQAAQVGTWTAAVAVQKRQQTGQVYPAELVTLMESLQRSSAR